MREISMKAMLRLTGLSADLVRAWERRYGAVSPKRLPSGRRIYGQAEVRRLKLLAELVRQGHSIGGIAGLPDSELVELRAGTRVPSIAGSENLADDVRDLLRAVGGFDLAEVQLLLARSRHAMSPREFANFLVPQLMSEVGRLIDEGRMSVAHEHALSDLVRHHLRKIYEELEPVNGSLKPERRLGFATPEGHHHDFGLLLAAVGCRYRGECTHFLGPNMPAEALAGAARELGLAAVVLGVSVLPPEEIKVKPDEYLARLDAALPKRTELWLGGPGVSGLRRRRSARETWVFESLDALDGKLRRLRARA
ncbi:MAG: MerR family transcriptional regulator [Bdellovibrionales bacterium]|nr:MerR family transcriptional regulator [Bdellovibrionales bacterium]